MKNLFLRLLFVAAAAVTVPVVSLHAADDLGAAKSRMESRLARIVEAKAKGSVGENNKGFLEVRGNAAEVNALVDEENRDRRSVYEALAKQTGATADAVGRARAKDLASKARPGDTLQKEDGSWYKK